MERKRSIPSLLQVEDNSQEKSQINSNDSNDDSNQSLKQGLEKCDLDSNPSKEEIKENPYRVGKGPKVQKPKKDSAEEINKLGFAKIGISSVTLWHKPAIKDIKLLKELKGIDLIVTLLYDKESPEQVITECGKQDIENFRIPMKGASEATLRDDETVERILSGLKDLHLKLSEKEYKVLMHCSAGVHRTGTIAYTLSRMSGLDRNEAYESLKIMREETYHSVNVGLDRIQISEELYIPRLLNNQ